MTTTIEPTQEQRDAAEKFCEDADNTVEREINDDVAYAVGVNALALFLAEREALAVGRAMRSFADALGGDAVNIAIESAVGRAMRDLVDELGGDVMGRATATAAEVRAMCDLHEQRAIDAITKRSAALLVDKDDLIRQLRRVEEDRDAAHAEIAALKAKLAKAEASLREVLNLAHGADDGLTLADCIPTEVAARAESALSPAGAGTEWAAPIAVADGTALRLVGQWPGNESDETIAALLADEKGGAK
jgi:hypothetical protein